MMCKECIHFNACTEEGDGTTDFYGKNNCCQNVEDLCSFFINSGSIVTLPFRKENLICDPDEEDPYIIVKYKAELIYAVGWKAKINDLIYGDYILAGDNNQTNEHLSEMIHKMYNQYKEVKKLLEKNAVNDKADISSINNNGDSFTDNEIWRLNWE